MSDAVLDQIAHLIDAGFAVHWLHPRSKRPIGDDWSEKPVASVDKLRKTWKDGNNVGVRLGEWSKVDGHCLHVIDLDIRDSSKADEARAQLRILFPDIATYPTVVSGSGGDSRHFYILADRAFSSRKLARAETFKMVFDKKVGREVKKWDWEIELFGTGKQVVLPPSIHPETGKPYRWLKKFDVETLDLDAPIVSAERMAELTQEDDSEVDPEQAKPLGLTVEEVRKLLAAYPNEDLDYDAWFEVMAAISHESAGRSKEERQEFYKAFLEWSRKSNKNDDKATKLKFWSFKHKPGRKLITIRTLKNAVREIELNEEFEDFTDAESDEFDDTTLDEPEFENFDAAGDYDDLIGDIEPSPKPAVSKREQKLRKGDVEASLGHVPPRVAKLNAKHAVAFINGKTVILTENRDGSVAYGTVGDLHNYYENNRVATEKATEPVTKAWLRHKMRREYPHGVVFTPGKPAEVDGAFNLWRGFSVEPNDEGSCRLILWHLKNIVCGGNEVAYRYAIGWWAHMIQQPEDKPGVAMVLRGKKGVGKDTIADYVGGIFPHHHIKIANQEHMVGRFNAHQEKCLLLHVEEGFWAGSKNADGVLKNMITSEKVFIEPKGLNGFHVASYLRLFMSSNERWVVPATEDERRYFVLDVPETKRNDHAYFRAIRNEMNNGGRAALLHYLMHYDLSEFNVRDVPDTTGLAEQKLEGLRNVEQWVRDMLESGELPGEVEGDWRSESARVVVEEFYDNYCAWFRNRRYQGSELTRVNFGRRIRRMLPSVEKVKGRDGNDRQYKYAFPPLDRCRGDFETFLGSEIRWDDEPVVEIAETESFDPFDLI